MKKTINVTIWNEFRHEKENDEVKALYPNGIHAYLKEVLECDDIKVTLASLDDPENGLPDEVINNTDVLIWWGHMYHGEVCDRVVEKVRNRVYMGMGLIALHSSHYSKVFDTVVGTTGHLTWGDNTKEVVWNINPTHPIAAGIPSHFVLEKEEVYAEPFQIPDPDESVFIGWYDTGRVFRSGNCWKRGYGKVFYFQPGHETVPTFYNKYVQRIIRNAVYWACPSETGYNTCAYSPYIGGDFVSDDECEYFAK